MNDWAIRAAFNLSRRIPLSLRYGVGEWANEAVYWCWASKRQHTRSNMAVVCGTAQATAQSNRLARLSWRNYGRYIVDFFNLPHLSPQEIVRRSIVYGFDHLDAAMAEGKGAMIVTCHFGLWDYAPALLADRYPGQVYLVVEEFSSPALDELITSQRLAQGSMLIPMTSPRKILRALKSNGIVCIVVDRPVQNDGIPVEFFGRPTMIPAGAATLAALTGAAMLPSYLMRRPGGRFTGHILPPVAHSTTGDREFDVRRMSQSIMQEMEKIILTDPSHWFMFRDMWGLHTATAPAQSTVTA